MLDAIYRDDDDEEKERNPFTFTLLDFASAVTPFFVHEEHKFGTRADYGTGHGQARISGPQT